MFPRSVILEESALSGWRLLDWMDGWMVELIGDSQVSGHKAD
jgi:hypothetical protein